MRFAPLPGRGPAAAVAIVIALAINACGTAAPLPSGSPTASGAPSESPAPPASTSPAPSASPSGSPAWSLSDLPTIGLSADSGARIVDVREVDERTRDLTIESPSVGTVQVRLLLPPGFDDDSGTVYPALYLLHGADGEYTDWTTKADAAGATAGTGVLVVMPAGASSFVGERTRNGSGPNGRPEWIPFHADELTQLMERNWRAGNERALAGLSLGGYEAIALAALHPGRYRAVASYSGALDISGELDQRTEQASPETKEQIDRIVAAAEEIGVYALPDLAPRLRGTRSIYVSYGNGDPGPLDPPDRRIDSPLERWCGGGSDLFVEELQKADIPVTVADYGDGTHSWPYWDRELRASLPKLLESVGAPVPHSDASPAPASPSPSPSPAA